MAQDITADTEQQQSSADTTEQDKAREYGKVIGQLEGQYKEEMGPDGDEKLAEAAAQIRAGEQVYGNEPSDGQKKLLFAADKQREAGQAEPEPEAAEPEPAAEPVPQENGVDQSIAQSTERFIDAANEAGMTESAGGTDAIEGNTYAASQTGDVVVLQNQETGGSLVAQDGEVLSSDGMTAEDQKRMSTSAEKMEALAAQQTQEQDSGPEL